MMKHFLKHGKVLHCSSKVVDHWHRICILFATGAPCVSKCKRRARGGKGGMGKAPSTADAAARGNTIATVVRSRNRRAKGD